MYIGLRLSDFVWKYYSTDLQKLFEREQDCMQSLSMADFSYKSEYWYNGKRFELIIYVSIEDRTDLGRNSNNNSGTTEN